MKYRNISVPGGHTCTVKKGLKELYASKQSIRPNYLLLFNGFLLGPCCVSIFWKSAIGLFPKIRNCFDKFYIPKFTENSLKNHQTTT